MKLKLLNIVAQFPTCDDFIQILQKSNFELLTKDFYETIKNVIKNVLTEANADEMIAAVDVIYNLSWEHINRGVFKEVPPIWRKVFAVSCLMLVYLDLRRMIEVSIDIAYLKRCLYLCDLSLMMGGALSHDDDSLSAAIASDIHEILSQLVKIDPPNESSFERNDKFDPTVNIPACILDKVKPLRRVECPSLEEFLGVMRAGIPLVIKGAIDDWGAMNWSVGRVLTLCGHRTVPVEVGGRYTDADWSQSLMTVAEFVDRFFHGNGGGRGYLAQHYLMSQVLELAADVEVPAYCHLDVDGDTTEVDINAWFGPCGTVSPLHHDPKSNLLCQIFGEKYVKLYPADQSDFLYPNESTMLKNTSRVDVLNPDLEMFPDFANADGFEGFLREGEVLFIPPKCWHYVQSLSASFSVNFWWSKYKNDL